MTNGEKYKTAEERRDAYQRYVREHWEPVNGFSWLEMEAEEELLPCPFCGNEVTIIRGENMERPYGIRCGKCGATMPMRKTKEAAIETWNRRMK